jgi:hypothetical protein
VDRWLVRGEGHVTAAVIALAVALVAAMGSLVWAVKMYFDADKRADNAHDLYAAQARLTDDVRIERDELVGKLANVDDQLREAKIRLGKTEEQRNRALDEARELVRQQIRSAPDAIAALNKIIAAGPAGSVQQPAEAKAGLAKTDSGSGDEAGLQITELR